MKSSRSVVNKRREKILERVKEVGDANVNILSEEFQVSTLTIRRDLQYLEDHNLLERFYGGARVSEEEAQGNYSNYLKREKIAKYAARFIEDGDSIFINTSATALSMIKYIESKNVTIITNNGNIINEKMPKGATVILLGGELRYMKGAMVGDFTLNNLNKVSVKKSFIGCSGICPELGMTTELINEVNINALMFERVSGDTYVLADGSKIGRRSSFVSCPPEMIGNIITDKSTPEEYLEGFSKKGIGIYLVD